MMASIHHFAPNLSTSDVQFFHAAKTYVICAWTVEHRDSLKITIHFLKRIFLLPVGILQEASCMFALHNKSRYSLVEDTEVDSKEVAMEDFPTFLASRRSSIFEFDGFWPQGFGWSVFGVLDGRMV